MKRVRDVLVSAVVVAAPVLVGGVHAEVAAGLVGALFVVLGIDEFRRLSGGDDPGGDARTCSIPSLVFWLFAAVCLLQVVPWPGFVLEVVDPRAAGIYEGGWRALFGEAPPEGYWRSISLDPGATFGRALRWLALGAAAVVGASWARRSSGWQTICRVVVGAGVAVTAVGAVQAWLGAERMLFVHEVTRVVDYTTFVSTNHAASFAGLVSLAGFFLAFYGRGRGMIEQWVGAAAGISFMLLAFEFGSAGATLAFVVAAGVFLSLFVTTRSAGELIPVDWMRRAVRGIGYALFALPAVVGLAFAYAPSSWRAALWETHVGAWLRERAALRFEMIRAALAGSGDFWLTGVGGGATDRALPPYVDWSVMRPVGIPTIENEPVEWLFHYGLPVGVVGIVLFVGYLWFAYRRYRGRSRFRYVAALSTAVYLAIIAQFHFPFLALGVSIPAVVLLESFAFPVRSEELEGAVGALDVSLDRGVVAVSASVRRAVLGVAVFAAAGALVGFLAYDVNLVQLDTAGAEERRERDYRELIELIPSDGNLYVHAAFASLEEGANREAVRRAAYAYEREPRANIGLLVAGIYASAGRTARARERYREIFGPRYTDVPARWVREYVVPELREPEAVAEVLEEGSPRHWRAAADLFRATAGPETAAQFGLRLHDLRPNAFVPNRIVVENYLAMGRYYLAETWVRTLMEPAAATEQQRAARVALLVRILRARRETSAARRAAFRAIVELGAATVELASAAVALRHENPGRAPQREAEAMRVAKRVVCRARDASRRNCWRAEAWLKEYRGDDAEARKVYRGLSEMTGDPRVFAEFLARRGDCKGLERFVRKWEFEKRAKKRREQIAEIAARCQGDGR